MLLTLLLRVTDDLGEDEVEAGESEGEDLRGVEGEQEEESAAGGGGTSSVAAAGGGGGGSEASSAAGGAGGGGMSPEGECISFLEEDVGKECRI